MSQPIYPITRRDNIVDDLCGFHVADPYRWLEDSDDLRTQEWAAEQDRLFAEYRARCFEPGRWISLVTRVSSFGVSETPIVRGPMRFVEERRRGDEQSRLLLIDADGSRRVLIDPVEVDPSGNTGLCGWWPSRDGKRVAFQLEVAEQPGSDIQLLDVYTAAVVEDPLPRARNTSVAWLPGGDAFYYVSRVPDEELAPGDLRLHRRVMLHRIGTPWQADVVVFGGPNSPDSYYGLTVSADGRHLAITATTSGPASHNDVWVAKLTNLEAPHFVKTVDGRVTRARVLPRFLPDNNLLLITDYQAPCGRICIANLHDDDPTAWQTIVAEDPNAPLDDCLVLHDRAFSQPLMVVARTRYTVSELALHDLDSGRLLTRLPLPGSGTVSCLRTASPQGRRVGFTYCDMATPPSIYQYDTGTGSVAQELSAPEIESLPPVQHQTIRYPAADGTDITLLICTPADAPDGPRPTLLYGYGSFGVPMRPLFSPLACAWVSAGGTYAVACVRGGGEEGQDWHDAGRGAHKHRAISDFNDAATWLVRSGWTTPDQLAVYGASGGGLLVTAAAMQRPELYAAVIASGPLCDLIRYERFGLGGTWIDEFGTANHPEQLAWLLAYSPYHHVTSGTSYPAFLFTGAVTDNQTGEAHVTKMCAALQHATSSERPILMRREPDSGHAAFSATKNNNLIADILAFAANRTRLTPQLEPPTLCRIDQHYPHRRDAMRG